MRSGGDREWFDPEELRKRWTEEVPRSEGRVHPKLARLAPPPDLFKEANDALAAIRLRVRHDLPGQREQLEPFLAEAEGLLRVVVEARGSAREPTEPGESPDGMATAAEQLLDVLWRIEDLLELYYFLAQQTRG